MLMFSLIINPIELKYGIIKNRDAFDIEDYILEFKALKFEIDLSLAIYNEEKKKNDYFYLTIKFTNIKSLAIHDIDNDLKVAVHNLISILKKIVKL